ncbi:hypothetical protein EJ08DRAFT_694822 [Tothia fuscella]|uniref:Uncharacterized protein n=1 Tax=Tothia fuscella TaxID=1048955 RepID=A0A9P4NWY0_9PEZI|nr:hypothetical protein EJ08DRAFT_694822 [Tothia fuscella]
MKTPTHHLTLLFLFLLTPALPTPIPTTATTLTQPLTAPEIALVNLFPGGTTCKGTRTPQRLARNVCYTTTSPSSVGFRIAAMVASVQGGKCSVVGYATGDCKGVGEGLIGGACYDGEEGVEGRPGSVKAVCGVGK